MNDAPFLAGHSSQVGEIRYMVDGVVYKRERIVTVDAVAEIDFQWCMRQVLERFFSCCQSGGEGSAY